MWDRRQDRHLLAVLSEYPEFVVVSSSLTDRPVDEEEDLDDRVFYFLPY